MCNYSNGITELNIFIDKDKNIFNSDGSKYIIPLYQRAFAWREKEICQLISDINDYDSSDNYYLGTLIVFKRNDGTFEVIDGQQRLTAFYILLNCLGFFGNKSETDIQNAPLTFECREKSNKTLLRLCSLERLNDDEFEHSIIEGKHIIEKELKSIDKDSFAEKLKKLIIFRIEVPPHTDLNRYFEVMNTRGEQLEQHDIVKSKLMETLAENKRDRFALIWDACSDMDGYVQMNFNPELRKALFDKKWNLAPKNIFIQVEEKNDKSSQNTNTDLNSPMSIKDIISKSKINIDYAEKETEPDEIRFESIVGFPHFLLHVLKIYVKNYCNQETQNLLGEQTDDKKLNESFDSVIESGVMKSGNKISENKAVFSEEFILCLLLCRFVFDKHIIKREYSKSNTLGKWSLKALYVGDYGKKAYYANTHSKANDKILMLQSCLRVSYVSAKTMHWITDLLNYLYGRISDTNDNPENFLSEIDKVASSAVKGAFFDKDGNAFDAMGINTQNIVFNYLDYLLWQEDSKKRKKNRKYSDFTFEFRNSVEHWYPQNPSNGLKKWDKVDRFGNLCLLQRQINSKFSNLSPDAKQREYKKMIAKASIKLRIMAESISDAENWLTKESEEHEAKMIKKLKDACKIK